MNPRLIKAIHVAIYLNLILGFVSALYMVFVVYKPEGGGIGPLWGAARGVTHEFLVQRRLYAIEAWVIFGFLSTYFALTTFRKK